MLSHDTVQSWQVALICPICGSSFLRDRYKVAHQRSSYCSRPCQFTAQRTALGTLDDRLRARIDTTTTPNGCYLWTSTLDHHGYGVIQNGRRQSLVHRLTLEKALGRRLSSKEFSCHTCDTPACTRADGPETTYVVNGIAYRCFGHLFVGDVKANWHDMMAKDRGPVGDRNGARLHPESWARGERHSQAKLTVAAVLDIRARHAAGGITKADLAREFGVTDVSIGAVISRRSWAHVT